jgi:hypothetical protein
MNAETVLTNYVERTDCGAPTFQWLSGAAFCVTARGVLRLEVQGRGVVPHFVAGDAHFDLAGVRAEDHEAARAHALARAKRNAIRVLLGWETTT